MALTNRPSCRWVLSPDGAERVSAGRGSGARYRGPLDVSVPMTAGVSGGGRQGGGPPWPGPGNPGPGGGRGGDDLRYGPDLWILGSPPPGGGAGAESGPITPRRRGHAGWSEWPGMILPSGDGRSGGGGGAHAVGALLSRTGRVGVPGGGAALVAAVGAGGTGGLGVGASGNVAYRSSRAGGGGVSWWPFDVRGSSPVFGAGVKGATTYGRSPTLVSGTPAAPVM